MRGSVSGTCCAAAKSGLSASSRPTAVMPPTEYLPAPSRKPRREIAPCTYWSNRFSTSRGKSAAVGRGMVVLSKVDPRVYPSGTVTLTTGALGQAAAAACSDFQPFLADRGVRAQLRRRALEHDAPMAHHDAALRD